MKTKMFLAILLILFIGLGIGCSNNSSSDNFFYKAAKEVAPAISESSSSLAKTSGNRIIAARYLGYGLLNDLYTMLRDYEFPRDEGVIDMHNIYKVIHTAGQIYEDAETSCTSISEAVVSSPFDLGLSGETYNCAGNSNTMTNDYANGFAIRESDGNKYGLLTYRWSPDAPDHEEHGILQGSYNENSGDLDIRMIHHVYYASEEGFVVRSHIAGNELTHLFTLSMISSGTGTNPYWTSFIGKGISKGEGNYFLVKARTSSSVVDTYFCLSSSVTEELLAEIEAITPYGSLTVDDNCLSYQADVDAMVFLSTDDVPKSLSDFEGSSILVSY